MSYSIKKQDNGKFTVRVWSKPDVFGKRKSTQKKDISGATSAEKWAKLTYEKLNEASSIYKGPDKKLIFNSLDDLYYEERKDKVSPVTLSTTFKYERNKVREYFGNLLVENITTPIVQRYIDQMQNDKLKKKSVENLVAYLQAVINWGVNYDYVEYNRIKKLNYKEDEEEFEATTLTIEQIAKILNYTKTHYYNLYIPTLISVLTSARRSEALGLTWENVDFENDCIYFRKGMVPADGYTITNNRLKTKSSKRIVPMAKFLKEELLEHRKKYAYKEQVCSNILIGTITPDYLTHTIHDVLLREFNIKMREHDLRHTFSQIIYENETLLLERSKMMGHSNPTITNRIYTKHTFSDTFKHMVSELGEIIREQMCAKKCAE